jgi:hypothetical protein
MAALIFKDRLQNSLNKKEIANLKENYLAMLRSKQFPKIENGDYKTFLNTVKCDHYNIGPYIDITIFEAAYRIVSDMPIFEGVLEPYNGKAIHKDSKVILRLGTMQEKGKGDFSVFEESREKQGEAFNVASSFFRNKMYKTLVKWKNNKLLSFVVFNENCLENESCRIYLENIEKKQKDITFIRVTPLK